MGEEGEEGLGDVSRDLRLEPEQSPYVAEQWPGK